MVRKQVDLTIRLKIGFRRLFRVPAIYFPARFTFRQDSKKPLKTLNDNNALKPTASEELYFPLCVHLIKEFCEKDRIKK